MINVTRSSMPPFEEYCEEIRGLELSDEARPFLVEEDLWVKPGEPVEAFSGANKTIGTLREKVSLQTKKISEEKFRALK